jgi:hypothetical protein
MPHTTAMPLCAMGMACKESCTRWLGAAARSGEEYGHTRQPACILSVVRVSGQPREAVVELQSGSSPYGVQVYGNA